MTREEAINEIKSWDFLEGKEIEAIHTLIPELTESEDERIRRAIIELLKEVGQDDTGVSENVKCMLAWLEKQKEQRPAEWSEDQMLKKSMPTWKRSRNNYEDPCIGSAFEKTGRRYTALYMGGYFIDLDDLFNKLPKEDSK